MIVTVWILVYFMGVDPNSDSGKNIEKDLGTFSTINECQELMNKGISDGVSNNDLKCVGINVFKDKLDSYPFVMKNWW